LLLVSNLPVDARSPQQSSDQTKPDSSSTNQSGKKNTGGATTQARNDPKDSTASAVSASGSSATVTATLKQSPSKNGGMVWVNTESGVYHKRRSRWYGKTKQGKYMLEADAIKAGYKASGSRSAGF
jgi:hypothetical protein